MKTGILLTLIFTLIAQNSLSQNGIIFKNQKCKSELLNKKVEFNIYLPPSYAKGKHYPTLYFLHGFGGNQNSSLRLMKKIDTLITQQNFPEIIVITPYADKTWYLDNYNNSVKYASFFIDEFKPFIDEKYYTIKEANKTVISGSSMGGFGAMRFALRYPEQFGICVSFQNGMATKEQFASDTNADYEKYYAHVYGKQTDRITPFFLANNPLYIAQGLKAEQLNKSKWYIQCCDDDYHSLPNSELHILFHGKKVKHQFRINDGTHNYKCVSSSFNDALQFVKEGLNIAKQ